MLSKEKRLNLKKDFKWVVSGSPRSSPRSSPRGEAGKKIETKFARLFIRMGDNPNPRVGIAVSSSLFKKATERNRARRVLSAAIEPIYAKLPQSINIVVLPKIGVLEVKSGDVLIDLTERLTRESVILDKPE